MNREKITEYYTLLEDLLDTMTDPGGFSLEDINRSLSGLCKLLRVSKGVTEFYNSVEHEKAGRGEVFVCYDSGEKSHEVLSRRILTRSMTVAKVTVFMADTEEPLDEEDNRRVDRIAKMVLSFISRNRLQGIVERMTFYDDAGYPNLRSFMRYIGQLSEKGQLGGHTAVNFNLRHFTLVNQEIGRNAGDVAMRSYYDMLSAVIGENGIVCRLGGDNFVAIFDDKDLDEVVRILKGVPVTYDPNEGNRIIVSASAGIFRMPEGYDIETPSDIMNMILSSLHAARNGGKGSIVFFDDKMVINKEKRMRIQQQFPPALEKEEFKVYYQPKIDIQTGEIVGAEALCRWLHEGKIIPPLDFIPILEETIDICRLDFYMLDHVCRDIRRWLDEGKKVVRVSVNLSRKHMMDVDLLEHIMQIINNNNVPHKYIEIELTETTTDVEFRDLKRVVNGLQQAGICTSVDDFGMGYSSLNLIKEIPWNVLKVDKSFLPVEEDDEGSTRSIMFKYVVAMAKALGLECIAEGVETADQVEILRHNDCLFAQGFYFDKPLPIDDFEQRLDKHHYDIKGTDREGKT